MRNLIILLEIVLVLAGCKTLQTGSANKGLPDSDHKYNGAYKISCTATSRPIQGGTIRDLDTFETACRKYDFYNVPSDDFEFPGYIHRGTAFVSAVGEAINGMWRHTVGEGDFDKSLNKKVRFEFESTTGRIYIYEDFTFDAICEYRVGTTGRYEDRTLGSCEVEM